MSEDEKPQEQPDEQREEELKPNPEHLAILKSGVEMWNAWREEHPDIVPQLQGADLKGRDLRKVDLQHAILVGARLQEADLRGADLPEAHLLMAELQEADLRRAQLQGAVLFRGKLQKADLRRAEFQGASLQDAELQEADLRNAYYQRADMHRAKLEEAKLQRANLEGAILDEVDIVGANLSWARVKDTSFQNVRWRPEGGGLPDPALYESFDVRGLRFSDPLFDQFVRQSEFIRKAQEAMSGTRRGRVLFRLWKLTCDCGRSLGRWLLTCGLVIVFFTVLFNVFEFLFKYPLVSLTKRATTPLTSLYFSMVTFSTLGFGDVTPCNWLGELAVMVEVFLGYVLLGGLITILAMKLVPPR